MVKIQAEPMNMVIIQVSMPTSAHEDAEVEELYDVLDEVISKVKGTEHLVDWNSIVGEGKEVKFVEDCGHGRLNNMLERLIEFLSPVDNDKHGRYTWKNSM